MNKRKVYQTVRYVLRGSYEIKSVKWLLFCTEYSIFSLLVILTFHRGNVKRREPEYIDQSIRR